MLGSIDNVGSGGVNESELSDRPLTKGLRVALVFHDKDLGR